MADEEILSGAPETTPAAGGQVADIAPGLAEPAAPDLIDYPVGDKTYKVERSFLEALRQSNKPQQPQQPAAPAEPEEDFDTLWYTNPKKAAETVRRQAVQEVRGLYEQEKFWTKFWGDFNRDNPDLVPARRFAEGLLQQNRGVFDPMTPEQAGKELARRTREEVLAASVNIRGNVPPPLPALAEGASQVTRDVTNFTDAASSAKVESLSQAIRARRESRRAVNAKSTSGE